MKNAKLLADTMCTEYLSSSDAKKYTKISTLVKENLNRSVFLSRCGNMLHVETDQASHVIFGIHRLQMALQSGHLDENLGRKSPRFPLRPLWLKCDHNILLHEKTQIAVPSFLIKDPNTIHLLCRRLLEWGYNAIVFGERAITPITATSEQCETFFNLCQVLKDYGIKIIGKSTFEGIDILFHEASFGKPSRDLTQLDQAIQEIKQLEQSHQEIIYFVGDLKAKWIPRLCDEVGSKTTIAFSPFVGNPWDEQNDPHPLWEVLRNSPDTSSTPLMPILNAGCLTLGEGEWPVPSADVIDFCFSRMNRHVFAGAMVMAHEIPERKTLQDCNLWSAAQLQWDFTSANLAAETWFKANLPDFNYAKHARSLMQFKLMALELKTLAGKSKSLDAWRIQSESILSRLNYEKIAFGQPKEFAIFFKNFEHAIRRILLG